MVAGFVLILAFSLTAQTNDFIGPELLNTPGIFIPDEAELSGLGGLVRVRLSIDQNGSATSVEQVTGPGWTCPQVTRPDVVAMRDAATKAALLGKFRPATLNGFPRSSSITLNFDFPAGESTEETAISEGLWVRSPNPLSAPGPIISVRRNDKLLARNAVTQSNAPGVVSGGVLNGRALSLVKPIFPAAARGITGIVYVQVWIDTDGEVFSAETVSGHPLFRLAAVSAACQSKFSVTNLSYKPVRVYGVITYNFTK